MPTDKLNRVDFHWYLVRTKPGREDELCRIVRQNKNKARNILEAYCPKHSTVKVNVGGKDYKSPLFDGYVFVLATQETLVDFLRKYYPNAVIRFNRKMAAEGKATLCTIPEAQMRMFKDYNENYPDMAIPLERPYTDYAFNPKTNEPNDIVKVIDGPLAGTEGYITKFRRDKRLVYHLKGLDMAVSIPNIWSFHVVRVHNAEGDKQTLGTVKERAVDLLIGLMQGCGYGDKTLPLLYEFVDELTFKPSLVDFCKSLYNKGYVELSQRMAKLNTKEAELLLNFVRYEKDNPGYVKSNWQKLVIRPFLTPTSGVGFIEGQDEAQLQHTSFNEIIRKVEITEDVYYPSKEEEGTVTTTYYAHIGIILNEDNNTSTLFANWDYFLDEYYLTAGKANEKLVGGEQQKDKLVDSFRNYAPTLYKVLTDDRSKVKPMRAFKIGGGSLNVMAMTNASNVEKAKDELINTCVNICKEISTTTHLAVWRRYLRTVWLHI